MKPNYEEQLRRVLRHQKRAHQFAVPDGQNFNSAVDSFIDFFIQSWALRDWLINSGFDKDKLRQHVEGDKYLRLCQDMANHQKHQKITRYKTPNDFVTEVVNTPISQSWDPFANKPIFGIRTWNVGRPVEVISVIDACVESWQGYISKELEAQENPMAKQS